MISLTYVSSAVCPFKSTDFIQLLNKCRENNEHLNITGMLLHKDGHFLQTLEGSPAGVRRIFKSISADPRHTAILTLVEEDVDIRLFKDLPMAFCNLNTLDARSTPGYAEFQNVSFMSSPFQRDPRQATKLFTILRAQL